MFSEMRNSTLVSQFLQFINLKFLYCRPLIFEAINYARSNDISFKYVGFTPWGCKDIENRKLQVDARV